MACNTFYDTMVRSYTPTTFYEMTHATFQSIGVVLRASGWGSSFIFPLPLLNFLHHFLSVGCAKQLFLYIDCIIAWIGNSCKASTTKIRNCSQINLKGTDKCSVHKHNSHCRTSDGWLPLFPRPPLSNMGCNWTKSISKKLIFLCFFSMSLLLIAVEIKLWTKIVWNGNIIFQRKIQY